MKEKELTKLKEDNKLLVKQMREKVKKRKETVPQVCSYWCDIVYVYKLQDQLVQQELRTRKRKIWRGVEDELW